MSWHPVVGYWDLNCQLGKGGVQCLDQLVWISSSLVGLTRVSEIDHISHRFPAIAAIFHSFLSRSVGVETSLGIVREPSANQARVGFLTCLGSRSFMVTPRTPRNICMPASLCGLYTGSVNSSVGASTVSWYYLHSSLYWWLRLLRLSQVFM